MVSTSSGAFMNRVPMDVGFHFDLSQYKKGNFSNGFNGRWIG